MLARRGVGVHFSVSRIVATAHTHGTILAGAAATILALQIALPMSKKLCHELVFAWGFRDFAERFLAKF